MPGLFGIVDLMPNASARGEEMQAHFASMSSILRHHDDDRLEQEVSGANMLIGRIGLRCQRSSFPAVRTEGGVMSLVSDRCASVPVFYTQANDYLFFAPEVKALLAVPFVQRDIDSQALGTFLAQGYLLGNQTLFRSIRRLRGGELLRVANGNVSTETYWRFAPGSAMDGTSEAELEAELGGLVDAAAAKDLGDPAKAIVFLSGGADSRGILGGAWTAVGRKGERLTTVSWGVAPGSDDSDAAIAARLARHVGTSHRFIQREVARYRERFARTNRLIDGLSDIAAFHPHEHQIMLDLRNAGYERVLRGDEVFGWSFQASTMDEALALVQLRRLRDAHGMAPAIRPEHYNALSEASDAAIEDVVSEARDLPPNQAKDYFYFAHRLQCYLHTGSYYKQMELDQRTVLLDDSILDFMARVPDPLRVDKLLYRNALARRHPDLARFPIAKRHNLENWAALLANEGPVRTYVLEELNDRSSGIWEYLDPAALMRLTAAPAATPAIRTVVKQTIQNLAPPLLSWIQKRRGSRRAAQMAPHQIILRALALKNWHDTFAGSNN